jgi:hypothetical protein
LFEAATSIVAAGGGRLEVRFEADFTFRSWCIDVIVAHEMMNLTEKQDDQ